MKYREDGEYSIDNNIAERNVRPFTVDRRNTMTFGIEECIDCAATYHYSDLPDDGCESVEVSSELLQEVL